MLFEKGKNLPSSCPWSDHFMLDPHEIEWVTNTISSPIGGINCLQLSVLKRNSGSISLIKVHFSIVLYHQWMHLSVGTIIQATEFFVIVLKSSSCSLIRVSRRYLENTLLLGCRLERNWNEEPHVSDSSVRCASLELKERERHSV